MSERVLEPEALERALSLRDLSDPNQGEHAMQQLIADARSALAKAWGCQVILHRSHPVVTVRDNYDRLYYPLEAVARDARYTRYVGPERVLRTHTTAMLPGLLRTLGPAPPEDALLLCPGLVYRRDVIDRMHTGAPHQLDLWRISRRKRLYRGDLEEMIERVTHAVLPGWRVKTTPAQHPYTLSGLQIDVKHGRDWVEIGECGLALPRLLADSGLEPGSYSGLAMGLGLDRILMLRKGLDDIRLLRSRDPRVSSQMRDLAPYRPVSNQPAVRRDLSLVVDCERSEEELGDRVRLALGERADSVESIEVVAETGARDLPETARARLGIAVDQKNTLLRIVLRDLEHTLTHAEANELRDRIYAALHEGPNPEWAAGEPPLVALSTAPRDARS